MFDRMRHHFHEEILCVVKLYKSGQLSVSPGFSTEEPEKYEESRIFLSGDSLDIKTTDGSRLTTFTFTSPSGALFQYVLEWEGQVVDVADLEKLHLLEVDEEYKRLSDRRNAIVSNISHLTTSLHYGVEDSVLLEFVSAQNFETLDCGIGSSSISIQYELTLPRGWMCNKRNVEKNKPNNIVVGSSNNAKPSYHAARFGICQTSNDRGRAIMYRLFIICCLFEWVSMYYMWVCYVNTSIYIYDVVLILKERHLS